MQILHVDTWKFDVAVCVSAVIIVLNVLPGIGNLAAQTKSGFMNTDSGAVLVLNIANGKAYCEGNEQLLLLPRPLGSLMKLLIIMAMDEEELEANRVRNCPPSSVDVPASKSCWYKPGHGNLNARQALAHSCNSWFRQQLQEMELSTLAALLQLDDSPASFDELVNSPLISAARLVTLLAAQFNGGRAHSAIKTPQGIRFVPTTRVPVREATTAFIREALTTAVLEGTGNAVQADDVLVKTGTAWSFGADGSIDHEMTDGHCILLYPSEKPLWLIYFLYPDHTGSEAAERLSENYQELIRKADESNGN